MLRITRARRGISGPKQYGLQQETIGLRAFRFTVQQRHQVIRVGRYKLSVSDDVILLQF